MYSTNKYATNFFQCLFLRFNIKLYSQWKNIAWFVQEWERLEI